MRQCLKDKIVIDRVGNFIIAHRKGNMDDVGVVKRKEGEPEDNEMGTILALARCFDRFSHVRIETMDAIRDILENPQNYVLITNQDKRENLYIKHKLKKDYCSSETIFYKNTKKYIFIEDLIFKKNKNRIK